jgi:hypothetical protein
LIRIWLSVVEDVDKRKKKLHQGQVPVRQAEEEEKEEKEDQDPLILRVTRIVWSCSSYPILSTTSASPTHNIDSRLKKNSSTKWMGMETTTSRSTHNLRRGVSSSCTLEEEVMEEVMSMLLDNSEIAEEEDNNEQLKSSMSKKDLEKKKMATLTLTKTKTVTFNTHPEPIPTPTTTNPNSTSTLPPSLRKKNKSSQTLPTTTILKPAYKHFKSCEPFLLLEKL